MRLKALVLGLLLWSAGSVSALAQGCTGNPAAGSICANVGATPTLPAWALATAVLDRNFGGPSTQGTMLNRGASVWSATATPALGKNGGTGGSLTLNGSTSGLSVIGVQAAAGSSAFNLPVGNGSANQVLITDGAGNTSWSNAGAGTVSSVALAMPGIFTVSGSPVVGAGTLTAALATQAANLVWAGPTTGAASAPTFRSLVGADLPNPSPSSLGGVQSLAAVSSQWIRQISTSGVPSASQPAFTDISGTLAAAQCPLPGASSVGCVQSFALQASKWISSISTSGVPSATQPNFTDISGSVSPSQLPSIGNNSVLGNNSGGTAIPSGLTTSNVLDMIGSTRGQVLYRGASGWSVLAPGASGTVLSSNGAGADPSYIAVGGTGTVTSVGAGAGLSASPSPIVTVGTISLATIANNSVMANVSGGAAVPIANTMTAILDATLGSTQGNLIYRGASNWTVLAPGTNGQVLTQGASTPSWSSVGTVSNVTLVGAGLTVNSGTCTISTTGTCTLTTTAATKANQQTGTSTTTVVTPAQQQSHDSAAKVVLMFTGSGSNGAQTINFNYNVVASTRTGVGVYSIALVNAFSSTSYACVGASNGGTTDGAVEFISQTTSSIVAVFKTFASGTQFDPVNGAYIVCYGRQ